jgi:hypothetical protein
MPNQLIKFVDFSAGYVDARCNPMNYSRTAIAAGEDLDILNKGLRTRPGYSGASSGSLPEGEVQVIQQVRFPGSGGKYLMAQVKQEASTIDRVWDDSAADPDEALSRNKAAWDESRGLFWKYGNGYDLVAYSWDTDSWTQFTTTGGPDTSIRYYGIIYDPVGDRLILFGGTVSGVYQSKVWEYDIDADTWTELTCTGTAPTARAYVACVYNSTDRTMVILGGRNALFCYADPYYELNLATLVWSEVTVVGDYPGSGALEGIGTYPAFCYLSDTNSLFVIGGSFEETCGKEAGILDLTAQTWTILGSMPDTRTPPEEDDYVCAGAIAFRCEGSDTVYLISELGRVFSYSIAGDEWTTVSDDPSNPTYALNVALTDDGHCIQEYAGTVKRMPNFCPGEWGTTPGFNRLYASPDDLPATDAQFTKIADLSDDAEPVSIAVLNDRAVIANIKDVPLVWGGCMTDDGSDWMFPKAGMEVSDGIHGNDITGTVCDSDPNTSVPVTLSAAGYLDICTDFVTLSGLYFDMAVANAGLSGSAADFSAVITYLDDTYISRLDLKDTITTYTKTSAGKGKFNQAVTAVTKGMQIVFDDGTTTTTISKTSDGTHDDDIVVNPDHATGTVSAIYAVAVNNSQLGLHYDTTSGFSTIWSSSPAGNVNLPNKSLRIPITVAVSGSGQFKISIKSGSLYGLTVSYASLVPRSGSTANGTTTPTTVTWNTGQSGFQIDKATTITSDAISGDTTAGNYLLCLDVSSSSVTITTGGWPPFSFSIGGTRPPIVTQTIDVSALAATSTGAGYYTKAWSAGTAPTYDQQTVTGFTLSAGGSLGITAISAITTATSALTANLQVATTTALNEADLSAADSFTGITITQSTPGNSKIYHAVSFDSFETAWIWKSAAWYEIIKFDSVWKFRADATTWTASTIDSFMGALQQALGVAANKVEKAAYEALTSGNWMSTNGIDLTRSSTLNFCHGFLADGQNCPKVSGVACQYTGFSVTKIDVRQAGQWNTIAGVTDNTDVGGVSLGQSGTMTFPATTADYDVIDGAAGFHFRLWTNGTSAGTAIAQIKYKADCQPLSNIGDGQPDTVLGAVYVDTSEDQINNIGSIVSDYVDTSLSAAAIPMATDDFLYVWYPTRFNAIEITVLDTGQNSTVASLLGAHWNGQAYVTIPVTDNTKASGKTLRKNGLVTWSIPANAAWKTCIPMEGDYYRGYVMRFSVSAALSAGTSITGLRVYPVPDPIVKHRAAAIYGNRLALAGRPDYSDQVDVSAPFAEYTFSGPNSGSWRGGGGDSVQAFFAMWDAMLVAKAESWHLFDGQTFNGVEASRHTPINNRVVIKAPLPGGDGNAIYFINQYGAWRLSGLQADNAFGTARVACLSSDVTWWDASQSWEGASGAQIDPASLYRACGCYWPARNWLIWSVPMIVDGGTGQPTCNRLVIYDIDRGAWLPPWTIPVASMCVAYFNNDDAPDKLGALGLYAGTYDGRVLQLMDGITDDGAVIPSWMTTGWLHLDMPEMEKLIRRIRLYGVGISDILITVYSDGETATRENCGPVTIHGLTGIAGKAFDFEDAKKYFTGNFHLIRLDFTGFTDLFGFEIEVPPIREEKLE